MSRSIRPLRDFLHRESSGGILILIASALGLIIANSPISETYFSFLELQFSLGNDSIYLKLTMLKVINYILMTLFFFVVGLEIKRELTSGHLSSFKKAVMPFVAALGGMAVPAMIYLLIAGREAPHRSYFNYCICLLNRNCPGMDCWLLAHCCLYCCTQEAPNQSGLCLCTSWSFALVLHVSRWNPSHLIWSSARNDDSKYC